MTVDLIPINSNTFINKDCIVEISYEMTIDKRFHINIISSAGKVYHNSFETKQEYIDWFKFYFGTPLKLEQP